MPDIGLARVIGAGIPVLLLLIAVAAMDAARRRGKGGVMHGGKLWERHPAVRTGTDLTLGERAADRLKAAFGSWTFVIVLNGFIACWVCLNLWAYSHHWDPYPFILLNLLLSWIAANQGGALQIASNRGDRIAAEVAAHTRENTDKLISAEAEVLVLQRQQMELLAGIAHANAELNLIRRAVAPGAANPGTGTDPATRRP